MCHTSRYTLNCIKDRNFDIQASKCEDEIQGKPQAVKKQTFVTTTHYMITELKEKNKSSKESTEKIMTKRSVQSATGA